MKTSRSFFPVRRRAAAFTLIELLMAVSITTLMVAFILNVTINVLNLWTRSTGILTSENQAALILDLITQDLRGAIMRRDGNSWFVATVQDEQSDQGNAAFTMGGVVTAQWKPPSPGIMKPNNANPGDRGSSLSLCPDRLNPLSDELNPLSGTYIAPTLATDTTRPAPNLQNYRFGQAGVWLRFFTVEPDLNNEDVQNASVPRAVAYQIVRTRLSTTLPDRTTPYRYLLFRSDVRPYNASTSSLSAINSTFAAGYKILAPSYNIPSSNNQLSDVTNIRRPRIEQVLGNNVIDFGIRVWARVSDSKGQDMYVLKFPISNTNLGFVASSNDGTTPLSSAGWTGNPGNISYGFRFPDSGSTAAPATPVYVDVFIRILDDEGVRLISLLENPPVEGYTPSLPPGITSPGELWWQTAIQHSKVYTRRVELLSFPL